MQQQRKNEFDWQFIITGVGFGIGAGLAAAPLMFCKEVQKRYDVGIDRVLSALLPMLGLVYYRSDDWRIGPDESFEEDDGTDIDEEEEHEDGFVGRYCVFCTKLDITRKKVIHDPKCNCHHSPPTSGSLSSSSSSSS
uniref:Uncharacterized protein n=1 Tax=Rhizophora mucronata TaxID=61149 RepID=A0A2P2QRT0_RHIMU